MHFLPGKAFFESLVTLRETGVEYCTPELKSCPTKEATTSSSTKKLILRTCWSCDSQFVKDPFIGIGYPINSTCRGVVDASFLVILDVQQKPKYGLWKAHEAWDKWGCNKWVKDTSNWVTKNSCEEDL